MPILLAPAPDFRHIGLRPGPRLGGGLVAGVLSASAAVGAGLLQLVGPTEALAGALVTFTGAALSLRKLLGPSTRRWNTRTVPMTIVPWGILLSHDSASTTRRWPDPSDHSRVLHWAAITRVHAEMTYGRDGGTPSTLWSVITVETERERFTARARGAVPLDSLVVHLEAYTREAGHAVALDLDGQREGEGPTEPDCEPLLAAARAYIESAPASRRLGLPPSGYRRTGAHAASSHTLEVLRGVLRDRSERRVDPRPFAAIVAAELGASDLVDELVPLAHSPHPVVAAVAKVAARRLGGSLPRVGGLEEVAPFLLPRDVDVLEAWEAASPLRDLPH